MEVSSCRRNDRPRANRLNCGVSLAHSYTPNALAFATAFTASVIFVLGIIVLIRGRATLASALFCAMSASGAGWLGSFALMYASQSAEVAIVWARAGHVMVCLIPAAAFHFAAVYTNNRRQMRGWTALCWFFCATVSLIGGATPLLVPAVSRYSWGWYARGPAYNFAWAAVYAVIMFAAMRLFWRAHRRAEGDERERAGLILVAFALGSLALVDVLPSIGIDMYPVGYMAILAFSIVSASAVWRFQLVDLTPEFAAGQILETMKSAVLVVDMEGRIRVVNRAAGAMLGYDAATMIGLHIRDVVHRNDNTNTAQILASSGVLEQTMLWRTANGSTLDVLAQSSFVREADGTPLAAIYVANDFTERKRAEEALRDSETRYRTLFDANPLPMWVFEIDSLRFIAVNDAAIRHYGYTREEFLGMRVSGVEVGERHRRKDGSLIDVEITSFELFFTERRSRLVIAQDVTERRRAQELLRESEERYRNVVELSPDAVFVHQDGKLIFVNTAAVKLVGASGAEQLVGTDIMQLVHPDFRTTVRSRLKVLSRGREVPLIEEKFLKLDGTPIDVEVAAISFQVDGKPAIQVVARDISERKAFEESLRQSELRYRDLFENANDIVYTHDLDGRITSMNLSCLRATGYSLDDVLSMNIRQFISPDDLRDLEDESAASYEIDFLAKDGRRIPVEVNTRLVFRDGRRVGVQGIARDVTERKSNEARFRLLFERNLAGVFRSTFDGRILECNDAMARIFGYERHEDLIDAPALDLYFNADDRQRYLQQLREQRSLTNIEMRMKRRDGLPVWVLENVALLEGSGRGESEIIEGTIIDVTDRKTAHEQIEWQAYHDALTGLPNRLLFRDRITIALARARRSGRLSAVMFLDLDQFKLVNDTLGHTVGDGLLQAVADRLVNCVRAEDTVARMGGDEFTILLSDIGDRRAAATVAQKVLDSIGQPIDVDRHELFVTTSIGISMFPEDGGDAETLLKNADRAMYRAKEFGRNNYQFVTAAAIDGAAERLSLENSLHHAFEREEFVVHYQPMIELATARVVGAEALIRWNHPDFGIMPPDEFIPIAEETRLIIPMGEWVLRTACRQMKAWHDAGHSSLRIAVNLSPRQFQQRDLTSMIERVLAETRFPANQLDLEITESTAMQNAELSLSIMKRLKEMGIRISIDDFGTGYSSLNYLKRFPIDTVKIDQDFVKDLSTESSDGAIISAVISMARALRLRVVAEGVETEEQLAFLQREQCAEIQGFLYSRPLPAAEFERTLKLATRATTERVIRP